MRAPLVALLAVCVGLCVCSRQRAKIPMAPEDRLARADQLRSKGDCVRAVTEYEHLLSEFPTQEMAEQAKFRLAQCQLELEQYDLARSGFEDFIDTYPKSDMVDNAMYMIGLSYLEEAPRVERDQTKTVLALEELDLLLREYPDTDTRQEAEQRIAECRSRLAHKEYLAGQLYMKMGRDEAAQVYFDSVIDQYGDTPWADLARQARAQVASAEGPSGPCPIQPEEIQQMQERTRAVQADLAEARSQAQALEEDLEQKQARVESLKMELQVLKARFQELRPAGWPEP